MLVGSVVFCSVPPRCLTNHSLACLETSSSLPGSSNRWVAPGMILSSFSVCTSRSDDDNGVMIFELAHLWMESYLGDGKDLLLFTFCTKLLHCLLVKLNDFPVQAADKTQGRHFAFWKVFACKRRRSSVHGTKCHKIKLTWYLQDQACLLWRLLPWLAGHLESWPLQLWLLPLPCWPRSILLKGPWSLVARGAIW